MRDLLVIGLIAIAVAIGAASLPARLARHTPVLQALAGRRPLPRIPRRLPVAGLIVSTLGCLIFGWVNGSESGGGDASAVFGITGAVMIVAGLVICTPYLVGLLERVATRASGSLRLSARTVARQRSRTGPTAAAIMAAVALGLPRAPSPYLWIHAIVASTKQVAR